MFGQALDLEGNSVRVQEIQIIGNVNGKFTDWVEFIDEPELVDSAVLIKTPKEDDLVGETFEINIIFVDDH